MLELAEVVGLEEQLTVPSRYQAHRVDVWISIRRRGPDEQWTEKFADVAGQHAYRLSPSGVFQLVAMNDERGWVVARNVDPRVISQRAVESLVGHIVERANACVTAPCAETVVARSPVSWIQRVRASIVLAGAGLAGVWTVARPRNEADVASSR